MTLFEQISVNLTTGTMSYPKLEGFTLDKERMYRETASFALYCSTELAVRHAIHAQLAAHAGLMTMRKGSR